MDCIWVVGVRRVFAIGDDAFDTRDNRVEMFNSAKNCETVITLAATHKVPVTFVFD